MAGANYMGGKRNYARSKSKDITGRAQKSHFMRQKHNILTQALRSDRNMDDFKEQRGNSSGRINEISLAHAKKILEQNGQSVRASLVPKPVVQTLLPSSSPGSTRENRLRNSKILEDLDINEPSGLKATVRRILCQPDLAGLNYSNLGSSNTEWLLDGYRKRRRTSAPSPSPSGPSSSFQHRSPVKKRPSYLPRPELPPPSSDHSNNNALMPSAPSSVLAEKSDTGNSSFGSSLDRLAALRGSEPRSTYSDSGFSELHFSDFGKDQARLDIPGAIGSDQRTGNGTVASPLSSFDSHRASTNDNGQFREKQNAASKFQDISEMVYPRPAGHSKYNDNEISLAYYLYGSVIDDGPEKSRSQSCLAAEADSDLPPDSGELKRYGVGYVPRDPDVKYKPFVPLATMLPAYSDDDIADTAGESGDESAFTALTPEEPMDSVNRMGNGLQGETSLGFPRTPSISPPAHVVLKSSSTCMRRQVCYQTPTRRSESSLMPMHKQSSSNRSRFSFPVHAYISNVRSGAQDQVSPRSHLTPSAHPRLTTPSVIFESLSPVVSLQTRSEGHRGGELRRITTLPRYELPNLFLEDISRVEANRGSSNLTTIVEADPNKASPDVSFCEPNVTIPTDNGRPVSNDCTALPSSPGLPSDDMVAWPVTGDKGYSDDVPSTANEVEDISFRVFDGPNLFADSVDDYDD